METLTFYIVRSKDGKYLRSKGYGSYGESWVTDLSKAKVYGKIGPANGQVTFWAGHYPEFGIPDVIPLVAQLGEPLNQDNRVQKALTKKELGKLTTELYHIQETFDKATREYQRHKSKYSLDKLNEVTQKMNKIEIRIKELK